LTDEVEVDGRPIEATVFAPLHGKRPEGLGVLDLLLLHGGVYFADHCVLLRWPRLGSTSRLGLVHCKHQQ
jgi:hypothetical protein